MPKKGRPAVIPGRKIRVSPLPGQSHLKLNYNVQYGNKNYHAAKRKGGDRNRIKANEVKDNEEGKRALVGQTDRTGRR